MERRVINPWEWSTRFGFDQAHEVTGAGRVLFLSGQTSIDGDGQVVHEGDMEGQIRKTIDNIETVLEAADMTVANIVRLTILVTDMDAYRQHSGELARLRSEGRNYASTLIGVSRLAYPELLIEIEATAVD